MIFIKILKNKIQIKSKKILIVFSDVIADMLNNKNLNPIVIGLFIKGRKLNISLVFTTQSWSAAPKNRRNSTHYFAMKIPNKRDFQQIALNHSSDIDFQDFMNLSKSVLQNLILLGLLLLLLHQIIFHERIF